MFHYFPSQTMYVKESNGTQTPYDLTNVRKMTISSNNLTVQKLDNSTGSYTLSGLKYLSFQDFTTGIEQQMLLSTAKLITYPNPVADMLTIDLIDQENRRGSISILSIEGKVMQEIKTNGIGTVALNLSQIPQGIYLCRYINESEIKTVKIIKQ